MPPRKSASTKAKDEEAEAAKQEPEAEGETPSQHARRLGAATSNESALLPPNAQAGAARAHGMLEELKTALDDDDTDLARSIAERAQEELDRYVPDAMRDSGRAEAAHVVQTEVK